MQHVRCKSVTQGCSCSVSQTPLIDMYLFDQTMVYRSCGNGLQHILVLPGVCAHACCPFRPGMLLHLSSFSTLPVPPQFLCCVLYLSNLCTCLPETLYKHVTLNHIVRARWYAHQCMIPCPLHADLCEALVYRRSHDLYTKSQ